MSAAADVRHPAGPDAGPDAGLDDAVPLAAQPAGDYAVLAWVDGVHARYGLAPAAEAGIVAGWDTLTPADVRARTTGVPAARPEPDPSLPTVRALAEAEIAEGLQTGAALAVSWPGGTADVVTGHNGDGAALTAATTVPWTCSAKPLGAAAFAAVWERGLVGPDTPVGEVLPEYAAAGKEGVAVRDLLTHTTGVPEPLMSLDVSGVQVTSWQDIDDLIWSTICAAPATSAPGTAMSYNPVTNWFVLDRLLTTLTGDASGDSHRTLFDRLGLSATLGADWTRPAEHRVTVTASADQQDGLATMQLISALPLPGAGVWGTVADLRVVGDLLARGGLHPDGRRLIGTAAVEALVSGHWPGTPSRMVCDTDFPYGLGVMTTPLVLGHRCSARAFGHAGGNTSTLLVDPRHGVVAAVYWNGRLNDVRTIARRYALVRALWQDLALPGPDAR